MADTQKGLRMAPARVKADALTASSVMAQVAQMNDDERAKLKAELADPVDEPEDDEDPMAGDKAKEKKADPACEGKASDEFNAGVAAANARFATVFASEHFEGRESRACAFLKTSMSADEITALLATEPKSSANGDAGGAAAIADAIRSANANVDAGGSADIEKPGSSGWGAAIAEHNSRRGF